MATDVHILKDMTVFEVEGISILGELRDIKMWSDEEGLWLWAECIVSLGRHLLDEYVGHSVHIKHDMAGQLVSKEAEMVCWELSAPSGEGNHYVVSFDEKRWLKEQPSLGQRIKRWFATQLDMRCAIDAAIERLEVNVNRTYDSPQLIAEEFTLKLE